MLADVFRKLLKRNFFKDVRERILILCTTPRRNVHRSVLETNQKVSNTTYESAIDTNLKTTQFYVWNLWKFSTLSNI